MQASVVQQDILEIAQSIADEAHALEGKTLLLSGGMGFLGSYIVATLQHLNRKVFKQPCEIVILDNYITGTRENRIIDLEDSSLWLIEHDVRKPIPPHIDAQYLLHAAGIASPVYYKKYPIETIEVAVDGTRNFLEYARTHKVKSVLYFSSSEIYGDPDPHYVPTPEEYWGNVSSTGPRSCYDESKRLSETLCVTYHKFFRVPVKMVRPFNVYGPGMKIKDYRVVPTFLASALRGEPLPVHDRGNQTRTFCYISDAIQGFLKVLLSGRDGEVYNVGKDREEINMVSLANIVSGISPRPVQVKLIEYPDTYPAGEPQRRCPDLTKIRTELGYDPRVDLPTGLKRTMSWFEAAVGQDAP